MGKAANGACALLCTALTVSASAQEYETLETPVAKSYFSTMVYGVKQDDDRVIDDDRGMGYRVLYGRAINSNWYWEGHFAHAELETGVGGFTDYYQTQLGLDFSYRFGDQEGYTPFILLGAGIVNDDVYPILPDRPQDDESSLFGNVGLGFVSREMGDVGIRVRGEARYVLSQFDDGFADWHFGLGVEVPLGRTKVVTKTKTKTVVQERVKEVAPFVVPPTPPADSDSDGVVDGVDRCPNTLRGAKVDQYGCAIKEQTIQLQGIFFESGSSELKPESRMELSKLAEFLKAQPEIKVEIAGHTDASGAASFNLSLSQQRADAVRFLLVREGIEPSRLSARGYGEDQPIANNDSSAGRALNRRVEFRIQR